jgi:hypothetical protein
MHYLLATHRQTLLLTALCVCCVLCVVVCGINTPVTYAQEFVPLSPELPLTDDNIWEVDIEKMLNALLMILLSAGAVLAVLFFAVSGIQYMATESIPGKGMAKEGMTRVFVGVLLLLSSVLILHTINPDIVQIDLFDNAYTATEITEKGVQFTETGSRALNETANEAANTNRTINTTTNTPAPYIGSTEAAQENQDQNETTLEEIQTEALRPNNALEGTILNTEQTEGGIEIEFTQRGRNTLLPDEIEITETVNITEENRSQLSTSTRRQLEYMEAQLENSGGDTATIDTRGDPLSE